MSAKLLELWSKNQNFKNSRHFEKYRDKWRKYDFFGIFSFSMIRVVLIEAYCEKNEILDILVQRGATPSLKRFELLQKEPCHVKPNYKLKLRGF